MDYNIGTEFSDIPAGRFKGEGDDFTGEHFREDVLKGLLENLADGETLNVKIDDVEGYGSSFLDEAFGGIVRKKYMSSEKLLSVLNIVCEDEDFEFFKKRILEYIKQADSK